MHQVFKTAAIVFIFALPLANAHAAETSNPHTYSYRCGHLDVVGTFTADQVTLTMDTRTLTLPQALSGSGARYADNAGNEFWGKGLREATLTLSGSPVKQCHGEGKERPANKPQKSIH